MLPLNPLYEVVPVGKVPGNTGLFIALRNEGSWQELWWDGFKWKQYEFGKNYDDVTHYLRPLPPERMEEMVREIVKDTWKAAVSYWADYESESSHPDLQTFTENLLKK